MASDNVVETLSKLVDQYSSQSEEENPAICYTLTTIRFFLAALHLAPTVFTNKDLLLGLDVLGRVQNDKKEKPSTELRRTALRELSGEIYKQLGEQPFQGNIERCLMFWSALSTKMYELLNQLPGKREILAPVARQIRREYRELVREDRVAKKP